MRAVVVREAGGPGVLTIEERPIPQPRAGWVVVRIHAFGLNRSELMTRAGDSGDAVKFPRVLGIECAGEAVESDDPALAPGTAIIAAMGGMGRDFDGGYQEYALLPATHVIPVKTALSWAELGAIPETFGTAWGALAALQLRAGQTLLVRGATSSVGMAAITLAKARGVTVIATTRQKAKRAALEANGADDIVIDDGTVATRVRASAPDGVDALLELVGPNTIIDSFRTLRSHSHASLTGVLEGVWDNPEAREAAQRLNITLNKFSSSEIDRKRYGTVFQTIIDGAEAGTFRLNVDRTFSLDDIAYAHRYMEANLATGKVVVLT